jgi:hypothetical protein
MYLQKKCVENFNRTIPRREQSFLAEFASSFSTLGIPKQVNVLYFRSIVA